MKPFVIADPGIAAALLSGRKTQWRVLARNPLAVVAPGDRIEVRESCIAARIRAGKFYETSRATAELVVFADGWRHHRDGRLEPGRRPSDPEREWIAAAQMPDWASRATLVVDRVRPEQLQAISPADARAEGIAPLLGGLLWRWPRPIPGLYPSSRRAFAHYWDLFHAPGERWTDDPEVAAIGFHIERKTERE